MMNAVAERYAEPPALAEIRERLQSRCGRDEVAKIVRLILGRYNQKPQGDPDVYVRQLTVLLAGYPAEVTRAFADPSTDPLPASDFLPSVSTVREAADRLKAELNRQWDFQQRLLPPPAEPEFDNGTEAEREEHVQQAKKKLGMDDPGAKLAEGFLPEHERSEAWWRLNELCKRTQCAPGEAIKQSDLYRTALSGGGEAGEMAKEDVEE